MKFSSYSSLYCFRLYDKLTYIAIYMGKYLQRRIPHASRGSFNPYIITNKEAHKKLPPIFFVSNIFLVIPCAFIYFRAKYAFETGKKE